MQARSTTRHLSILAAMVIGVTVISVNPAAAQTSVPTSGAVLAAAPERAPAVAPLPVPAVAGAAAAASRMHLVFADNIGSGELTRMMEYGNYGEQVIVGDWDGDGKDGVAIRRGSTYYFRNTLSSGSPWKIWSFGRASDQVLVGDWNGDGKDTLALRRGTEFIVRNHLSSSAAGDRRFHWGRASDGVLVGDWDGDGKDTFALHRSNGFRFSNALGGAVQWSMNYGRASDAGLAGDWDGNGRDSIGVRRGTNVYLRNATTTGGANIIRSWGSSSDRILIGDWTGAGADKIGAARKYNERYRVWELVNAERTKAGRAKVTYSENCLRNRYAQAWANHLAATSKFEHQQLGRGLCSPDAMAENIAAGYRTASSVMKGWMNSPGHKANILSSARRSVTVGIASSSDAYGTYWVQNFT